MSNNGGINGSRPSRSFSDRLNLPKIEPPDYVQNWRKNRIDPATTTAQEVGEYMRAKIWKYEADDLIDLDLWEIFRDDFDVFASAEAKGDPPTEILFNIIERRTAEELIRSRLRKLLTIRRAWVRQPGQGSVKHGTKRTAAEVLDDLLHEEEHHVWTGDDIVKLRRDEGLEHWYSVALQSAAGYVPTWASTARPSQTPSQQMTRPQTPIQRYALDLRIDTFNCIIHSLRVTIIRVHHIEGGEERLFVAANLPSSRPPPEQLLRPSPMPGDFPSTPADRSLLRQLNEGQITDPLQKNVDSGDLRRYLEAQNTPLAEKTRRNDQRRRLTVETNFREEHTQAQIQQPLYNPQPQRIQSSAENLETIINSGYGAPNAKFPLVPLYNQQQGNWSNQGQGGGNISNLSKAVIEIMKAYSNKDEMKYSGNLNGESLDAKVQCMLTGKAERYYTRHLSDINNINSVVTLLKTTFEGPDYYVKNDQLINEITLQSTIDENPSKTI
ncbi:hypothetical protein BJ878DRAFT_483779 [Calycina marina]|uniref:Uncharacterized protein n=1 Tax=Calycina marina TaxID=1763456 RepID=A0A9P7YVE2_9HELO|nr:hypothetical protein BJ878DRAFT_483779 [Calycina marina]